MFGAVLAALPSVVSLGSSILGATKGIGDSHVAGVQIPEYQLDEYYGKSQEDLYGLGSGLLSGNLPSYYSPIGEIGGDLFESVLQSGVNDITKTGIEANARLGIRGSRGMQPILSEVSDYSNQMRYQDMLRALEGRQYLLGAGADILGGVRSGSLTQSGIENQYNLNATKLALGKASSEDEWDLLDQAYRAKAVSSGVGAIGNLGSVLGIS